MHCILNSLGEGSLHIARKHKAISIKSVKRAKNNITGFCNNSKKDRVNTKKNDKITLRASKNI